MHLRYFIFLLGLILIHSLSGNNPGGPWHRFAQALDGVPIAGVADLIHDGQRLWVAGQGIASYDGSGWSLAGHGGKAYSALAYEQERQRIWYGGVDFFGYLDPANERSEEFELAAGYIWNLSPVQGRIWYFGSFGFGYGSLREPDSGNYWNHEFSPRPVVHGPWPNVEKMFVGDSAGLWEIGLSGAELLFPAESFGGLIPAWMLTDGLGFVIGTTDRIYRWSGRTNEEPVADDQELGGYFQLGVGSVADLGTAAAIAEYPQGVVLIDKSAGAVKGLVRSASGLNVGDTFKVAGGPGGRLYVLGSEGLATVSLDDSQLFFPEQQLFRSEKPRGVVAADERVGVYSSRELFWLSADGFTRRPLPYPPAWMTKNTSGRLVMGSVNAYETYIDDEWQRGQLDVPVKQVFWGQKRGYALSVDGIASLTQDLNLEPIPHSSEAQRILGELGDALVFLGAGNRLQRLVATAAGWQEQLYDQRVHGRIVGVSRGNASIRIATTLGLYTLSTTEAELSLLAPGWQIQAMSESNVLLYYHPSSGRVAVGILNNGRHEFIEISRLDHLGEPMMIEKARDALAIVGSGGVLWINVSGLQRIVRPKVSVELQVDAQAITGRRLPSGSYLVDFNARSVHSSVPYDLSYRINEGEWRSLPVGTSLPFSGSGKFNIGVRAVFPDGSTGDTAKFDFTIAPPWYQNAYFQIGLIVLLIVTGGGLYYLRHYNLQRLNEWLKSEVRKQTRELEAATAARTNFLAGLSHDIRNPLNAVLMITEALSRRPPVDAKDSRLGDLREFSTLVDRMLGEILDFTAIDQKGLPLAIAPVAVRDVINSTVQQNQWAIQRANIQVVVSIPQPLLALTVGTDRNCMIQILSNLLDNAIHYANSESIEVGVREVGKYRNYHDLEFYVQDWGIGIDDAEKEYVFERFYRGDSGVESGRHGTGLGLSICRDMAHAMGSQLVVEDTIPHGCRFVLKGRFEEKDGTAVLDVERVLESLDGKRVLVVDDLKYNLMAVVDFLHQLGCACDSCENGKEALTLLSEKSYDLALLDWDLPGLSGPEIARRHRKRFPADPVVLLAVTAYTDAEKKAESMQAGMNGYISKPLSANRLAHALAMLPNRPVELKLDTPRGLESELTREIQVHVEECLLEGKRYKLEALRRAAHRLTTLAMMANDRPLQNLCREIQLAVRENRLEDVPELIQDLKRWKED